MLSLSYALLIAFTVLSCFLVSKLLKNKLQKLIKKRKRNFVFELISSLLQPLMFFGLSVLMFVLLLLANNGFKVHHLFELSNGAVFSGISLVFKLSVIWAIYRVANLSSVNKSINKFFIVLILLFSLFKFIGLSSYVAGFFENFKTSFADVEVSVYTGLLFIVFFAGIFWFGKIILEILHKVLETSSIKTNTRVLLIKFFTMILIATAVIVSLTSSGIDLKSLTMFGSALVVGLGFGFQKVVSNIISGITISFEEIIKEGDIITIDDKREINGVVKSMHMRYILVAEFDGREVIVPNDVIVTSNISNLTHSNSLLRIRTDIVVPIDIDIQKFKTDVLSVMQANPFASKIENCVFHILRISEAGTHCFLYFWIDNSFDISAARTSLMFDLLDYVNKQGIKLAPPLSKVEIIKL